MSRSTIHWVVVGLVLFLLLPVSISWGRGGRGGGGGGRGGGGGGGFRGGGGGGGMRAGGARPSPSMSRSPSFSSPQRSRPAGGSRPAGSAGARPGGARPSQAVGSLSRPGGGGGPQAMSRPGAVDRPQFGAGRPPISQPGRGNGLASRPQPGARPDLPGAGRPGQGGIASSRPGVWDRPGANRPTTLPGLPGPGLGNRPGIGDRPVGNHPNWGDRQIAGNVNDLRQNNLNNIQNNFNIRNDFNNRNWQDFRDNHPNWHEDWHDWHHDWHHGAWYHGYWNGNYNNYWNNLWDNYPAAAAFGLTAWGVNQMGYYFGYSPYYNPYWTTPVADTGYYNYSEPLIVDQPLTQETLTSTDTGEVLPPDVTPQSTSKFDQARQAFTDGDYTQALTLADQAIQELPRDAALHEFRALTLFAMGRYQDAAETLHPVLAAGPGWDWTTLSGLYGDSVAAYTDQLRALESYVKKNPSQADAHFLLAYHYLTAGHSDAAAAQLKLVVQQQPKDQVSAQLLEMLTGNQPGDQNVAPAPEPQSPDQPTIPKQSLEGDWNAQGADGAKFALSLNDKDEFVWTYTQKDKTQTVRGVYGIDGDTLALQPDTGGTMLAQVTEPKSGKFHFQMIGAPSGDPGLDFKQ